MGVGDKVRCGKVNLLSKFSFTSGRVYTILETRSAYHGYARICDDLGDDFWISPSNFETGRFRLIKEEEISW